MEFIVYTKPPYDLIDFFRQVPENDPIRKILSGIPSFEKALESLEEGDFENYGVFISLENPLTHIVKKTSFFIQKQKITNKKLIPIPPFYVYRRIVKNATKPFLPFQQEWLTETIVSRLFSGREGIIHFTAGEETRGIRINPLLKQELCVEVDPVPLLVLDTPKKSLDFAEFVVGMLHQTTPTETQCFLEKNKGILDTMSVDRRKKLYDIFPEEFVHIPRHVLDFLKCMDDFEFSNQDVEELYNKYKNTD